MLPQRWRFVVYNDCGVQLDFSANSANEKGWAIIRRTIVNPADGKTDCHGDDTSGTKHSALSDLADGAVLALTAMSRKRHADGGDNYACWSRLYHHGFHAVRCRIPTLAKAMQVRASRGALSEAPELWKGLQLLMYGGGFTTKKCFNFSGYGNNGTPTEGPTVVRSPYGRALDFDGINDRVVVPDGAWTRPINDADQISFGALASITETGADQWFLGRYASAQDQVLAVRSGKFAIFIRGAAWCESAGTYNDGTWHVFCGTYDGLTIRGYVDQEEVITQAKSGLSLGSTAEWFIGGHSSYPCECKIALAWCYARGLAYSQVCQHATDPLAHLRLRRRPSVLAVPSGFGGKSYILGGGNSHVLGV